MNNQQNQGRTHIPGHGNHVCNKCGWSYSNPHPSAKQRRAHRKLCGSMSGSYDNIVFDDDNHKPGLLVSASNNLDADKTEKRMDGIGGLDKSRPEDGVFSDPVANSSASGLSPGIKEPLKQDTLDSGTTVEEISTKAHEVSVSPINSDFVNDESQLIFKSGNGFQVGNASDLEGQLSASIVDLSRSSVADLRTEESTFMQSNGFFDLPSNSRPSKPEALSNAFPENNIYTGENAIGCSLISAAKETNLIAKDVIQSDVVVIENVDSSDNIVDETCEGVFDIAGSGTFSLDHQVANEAANLMEKKSTEFLSLRAEDDIPLELNSVEITNAPTNGFPVESTHVKQFSTSRDVNILQEKGEVNGNVGTPPTHDDSSEVANPQNEYEGFKDPDGVVSQDPDGTPPTYESPKREDTSNSVTKENTFVFNPTQLSEKSVILSPEVHVASSTSSTKELVNFKPMPEEAHAEEHTEASEAKKVIFKPSQFNVLSPDMHVVSSTDSMKEPVNFDSIEPNTEKNTEVSPDNLEVESFDRLETIGGSTKAIETETNESHIIPLTEEQRTVHSCKDSQQISLPEGNVVASSIENPGDATFASATSETKDIGINDIVVDGNNVRANVENDSGSKTKDLQPSDLLQLDAEQSRDSVKSEEVSEITAMPVQCRKDEISIHVKVHEEYSRSIDPSGDSHHTQDAELLVKPVENLAAKYTSLSLNSETSTQHDSAAEDNKDGEQGGKASGITYVPVQDRSVNNLVKHSSSGHDASIDSSSRCGSLEGIRGSVSVTSLQCDAPAVIDAKTLPSTGSLASTEEAGKSNVNNPEESFYQQQTGKSEMSKAAASEFKKGSNSQQSDSTITQVITNESPGRKKNDETIAKVTNPGTGKVRRYLKSLLDEAAESEKANSSTIGGHSLNQENSKFPEHNSSGLKTVNSILGPESPAAEAKNRETTEEWNSPARYPAGTKEEKGKLKTRSFWIQLVCCSSMDPQPSRS